MQLPPIIVTRGNHKNRLTICSKRISVKLRDDVSKEDENKIKAFSLMIAQRVLIIYRQSMRGTFSKDLNSIEMTNTSRSLFCLYCWDELWPEGFAHSNVKSNKLTEKPKPKRNYQNPYYQNPYFGDWDDDDYIIRTPYDHDFID